MYIYSLHLIHVGYTECNRKKIRHSSFDIKEAADDFNKF